MPGAAGRAGQPVHPLGGLGPAACSPAALQHAGAPSRTGSRRASRLALAEGGGPALGPPGGKLPGGPCSLAWGCSHDWWRRCPRHLAGPLHHLRSLWPGLLPADPLEAGSMRELHLARATCPQRQIMWCSPSLLGQELACPRAWHPRGMLHKLSCLCQADASSRQISSLNRSSQPWVPVREFPHVQAAC